MPVRLHAEIPAAPPQRLEVRGESFHYLSRVLRLETGDALEVFDGAGRAFAARVVALGKEEATLELGAPVTARAPTRRITVVQGLPKGDKLELVVQKATELGAAAIVPVVTARSVPKLDAKGAKKKQERWSKIATEAARQCGRSDVPEVTEPRALLDAARALAASSTLLVLDEEEKALSLSRALASVGAQAPLALVIGPEGGLTRDEVAQLERLGARSVTLGARILRTETAALAALAVLLHLSGELG